MTFRSVTHWWRAVKRELRRLEEGLTDPDEGNWEVLSAFAHGMSRLLQPRSIWTAVTSSGLIRKARELWSHPAIQAGAYVVLTVAIALSDDGLDDGWMSVLPFSFEADDAQDAAADELLVGGLCRAMAGRSRAVDAKGVKTNTQGP